MGTPCVTILWGRWRFFGWPGRGYCRLYLSVWYGL